MEGVLEEDAVLDEDCPKPVGDRGQRKAGRESKGVSWEWSRSGGGRGYEQRGTEER